jgi:hypothetical protein
VLADKSTNEETAIAFFHDFNLIFSKTFLSFRSGVDRRRRTGTRVEKGFEMNSVIAYLDPSTGSLIVQALVGGFSGLVVLGRYLWIRLTERKPVQTSTALSAEISIPRTLH